MITTEDMQRIMTDELLGRPQRVTGPQADKFLQDFRSDRELAEKDGVVLDVPLEWPEMDE